MNNSFISDIDLKLLKEKYQGESLDIAINKIKNGYPVQYLIGNVNFYGNKITVNENVLIPRFETEFLVDLISNILDKSKDYKILDIGTGSGCISISLGKIFISSNITGIDISQKAIDVANDNKIINAVNNVDFIHKDLFQMDNFNGYDVIVSNPPYVSKNEPVGEETKYEPQNAIFADNDGLVFYENIIKKVSLSKKIKHIFFEIGMTQSSPIIEFKNKYLDNYEINIYKDLSGKDRYVHIYLNNI